MDWLFDQRTECWSLQTTMTIGAYLNLVGKAHAMRGALSGQRAVLTTTTAKRIRSRMVADLKLGAVLPPVVIGIVVDEDLFAQLPNDGETSVERILEQADLSTLSIIDGMQRTAAMQEALKEESSVS